ncbi:DUF2189 domain-containing protein [Acidocella aromatica]|uniref:Putative membrane protein n=1 Tax=Acidocella aromatica TaxID=1303579 RepID=A0A840VEY6_9PROT|nr:DUF2189 domain-containing protein [Acidocella aromatica]MBB5371795.1 putative membrane protein [Acidocella aromatica]
MHIRNPVEWVLGQFHATEMLGSAAPETYFSTTESGPPMVRPIGFADVFLALGQGWEDFTAARTDLIMLWLIYPVMAAYLVAADFYGQLIPLLFPVASGFALVGPLFAIGFYEMSRQRELTGQMHWRDGFNVLRSPAIGAITGMGLTLIALFLAWLAVAELIYDVTLGPVQPTGWLPFFSAVLTTPRGWEMIVLGVGIGAVFAVLVLVIASISFPLLLDRPATLGTAIRTSVAAIMLNPAPLALWGAIVGGGLVLGTIPAFAGLIVVLPVLGHGTWHLYRTMVPRPGSAA